MDTERQPKEPKDLYRLLYPIAKLALDYKYTLEVEGVENIPDEPAIFAANHIHAVDSLFVSEAYTEQTGKPIRFAVKRGYVDGTGIDDKGKFGRTARFVVNHTLQVPVDREGGDKEAYKVFENGVRRTFERGDSFAIHPEGTRSNDGRLHKFKSGVGRLAIANKVPAVPVGLVYDTSSNKRKINVRVSFGTPVMPEELQRYPYTALLGNKYKADHLTQVLENRVAQQTGMDQSGMFAVLRKLRGIKSND